MKVVEKNVEKISKKNGIYKTPYRNLLFHDQNKTHTHTLIPASPALREHCIRGRKNVRSEDLQKGETFCDQCVAMPIMNFSYLRMTILTESV